VIFGDSSFWIGLSDELDGRHAEATDLLRLQDRTQLVTTNHVLARPGRFCGSDIATPLR
jgi:hypothetical protein